ncbi:MAG: N-acylglucosamine 2-epimerase [Bacteroidia bacterium]|nr:MAG: N-acylglucosamine 2-epimerase [Bacteroidia bacterium]
MRLDDCKNLYRDGLLSDTIPFWIPRSLDREHGGFIHVLDRDGSVLSTDKSIWLQARFSWMLATLYLSVEPRKEWLEAARSGVEFLARHGFDADHRMFFWVTREGKPLRKRRYVFSELFTAMAYAAFSLASGDARWASQGREVFKTALRYHTTPGLLSPKVDPKTRPMKGLAMTMMLIAAAQELRKAVNDPLFTTVIDDGINDIERHFLKPEFKCLMENVGPKGEVYDTLDGRQVNPGHSLEAGWFILAEGRYRNNDPRLIRLGTTIIDWSYEIGLDREYGGLLYFRDARGLPPTEYWHDMKFWWPHNEAIVATLMAWRCTGDRKYLDWHATMHDWAYSHFPDKEHGEWFGYLRRDGAISTPVKGTMWKGMFHLPRMQLLGWKLLEEQEGIENSRV